VTKRRILMSSTVAIVAASCLVTAWWWLRAPGTPSASRPGLTLLVNLRPHVEMTPGTPVVFEVSLGSGVSSPSVEVGSRWRPWHALVRLEETGGSGGSWPLTRMRPRSVHLIRGTDGRLSVMENTLAVAQLEAGRHVHTVTFGAGPDETAGIKPGTYRFRAILETPFWMFWGWRGRVESTATVVVVDPSRGDKAPALESQRLARAADFYVNAGRFADAHRVATALTVRMPKDSRSYVLLGDAAAGLDRREEALAAYYRAVALLPRSYEQPTLIYERINGVLR
jgi:hypothetical protein